MQGIPLQHYVLPQVEEFPSPLAALHLRPFGLGERAYKSQLNSPDEEGSPFSFDTVIGAILLVK